MIGGIDQQIQQKVDAYRGNPQQLMQRYQQNQELIDLLALQKLKSEKDAAAREMQMQMQTTPQTIRDQREAELLGRTKDEMVQQTGGIMQERAKRQQQNMQRTANQGLPQLPAGNMQQMAGGGIVSFAKGGLNDVDARMRQLIEAALELGESPEALAERLKDNPNALAILRSVQPQQVDRPRQASMGERPEPRGIMSPRLASEAGIMSGPLATPPTPKEGGLASMLPERKPSMQRTEQRGMGTRGDGEPDGIVQAVSSLFDDTGERARTRREVAEGVRAPQDTPQDALQEIDTSQIPEKMDMPESQAPMAPAPAAPTSTPPAPQGIAAVGPRASYEARQAEYEKLLKAQQSPEELAKERRAAWLGSKTGMRGAAVSRTEAAQKARELQGIEKLMGVDKELMTVDQEAQKMELEKESTRLLGEIRQGQLTAAQMNSIAGEISSMAEQVELSLMQDTTYRTLDEQYQEAVEGGDTAMAETLLRQREQYRQSKIESMYPNYADLVKTQKELNQKMLGSAGFGKVERLSQ